MFGTRTETADIFLPYIGDDRVDKIMEYTPFGWKEKYIPMYRYRGMHREMGFAFAELLGKHFENTYKSFRIRHKKPFKRTWNTRDPKDPQYNRKIIIENESIKLFDDLMKRRTEEGTKIVLVYAPIYSEVFDYLENHDTIWTIYNNIAEKYNIPVLDYTNISWSSDTTYFADFVHTNFRGTELFTKQLVHDIDSLGLLK